MNLNFTVGTTITYCTAIVTALTHHMQHAFISPLLFVDL